MIHADERGGRARFTASQAPALIGASVTWAVAGTGTKRGFLAYHQTFPPARGGTEVTMKPYRVLDQWPVVTGIGIFTAYMLVVVTCLAVFGA